MIHYSFAKDVVASCFCPESVPFSSFLSPPEQMSNEIYHNQLHELLEEAPRRGKSRVGLTCTAHSPAVSLSVYIVPLPTALPTSQMCYQRTPEYIWHFKVLWSKSPYKYRMFVLPRDSILEDAKPPTEVNWLGIWSKMSLYSKSDVTPSAPPTPTPGSSVQSTYSLLNNSSSPGLPTLVDGFWPTSKTFCCCLYCPVPCLLCPYIHF